jgi:hypothetical protein
MGRLSAPGRRFATIASSIPASPGISLEPPCTSSPYWLGDFSHSAFANDHLQDKGLHGLRLLYTPCRFDEHTSAIGGPEARATRRGAPRATVAFPSRIRLHGKHDVTRTTVDTQRGIGPRSDFSHSSSRALSSIVIGAVRPPGQLQPGMPWASLSGLKGRLQPCAMGFHFKGST